MSYVQSTIIHPGDSQRYENVTIDPEVFPYLIRATMKKSFLVNIWVNLDLGKFLIRTNEIYDFTLIQH
jgi:hypothetical protein